ncbi:MAG: YifB family Mg chelatase-like AAA ATPase [Eubacterium sp.]|nr:YifB family Mg chelatase-like AAA ATPase [Eubacterium sp.]
MYSVVTTAMVLGIDCRFICVEADVSGGLPCFEMVGYLSSEVREAKERVQTALRNSGFELPVARIIINLSPINLRKEGNLYDLPVAIAVLAAVGTIKAEDLNDWIVIGEVGLDGKIHSAGGVLPIVNAAKEAGFKGCILPVNNVEEGLLVNDMDIRGVNNVAEAIEFLNLDPCVRESLRSKGNEKIKPDKDFDVDFSEISGQKLVKRACEVAVAGMHNFLMIGPPGAGKTMIARRIPTILPSMSKDEQMEISKIYSVGGHLRGGELIKNRPFRSPHHSVSLQGMTGGGRFPKPGEVSYANGGVLFLDELPEFQRSVLESLREPLEDKKITIVRTTGSFEYPSDFMLCCAMNPCQCGYYPDRNLCNCSVNMIQNYLGKISRPLLDRIDICVEASRITYKDITSAEKAESSQEIRKRVELAHSIQRHRYKNAGIHFNSQLSGSMINEFCVLNHEEREFLDEAYEKYNLTARSYFKILKVARTIADLAGNPDIEMEDLTEALIYKGLDFKYFREVT